MSCINPTPIYLPHSDEGLVLVNANPDGYSISLQWIQAYLQNFDGYRAGTYSIAYNIYYSTIKQDVLKEGPKAISFASNSLTTTLLDFTPGDVFFFCLRAFQYDSTWYNFNFLPDLYNNLKFYPESILSEDINDSQLHLPLQDISLFPAYGLIQIGSEIIKYIGKDLENNYLILDNIDQRGFANSLAKEHQMDGYDGYFYQDPIVRFFKGFEEDNLVILQDQCAFDYNNYPYTVVDGYRIVTKDFLNNDLDQIDSDEEDRPFYDYTGYHRTDPESLFNGDCVDSYIGGEINCADGYGGVGQQVRGISLKDISHRRLEIENNLTGEECILVRRKFTGITCACVVINNQNPQFRCPLCWGTGFAGGYNQYFNPRMDSGRIKVRFGPTDDNLPIDEIGLKQNEIPDCWTLVTPGIKSRDFIIRFYKSTNIEKGRYEILKVTRNELMFGDSGEQKFTASLLDKTYPQYTWRINSNTSTIPTKVSTGVGFILGANQNLIPHQHQVTVSEKTLSLTDINSTTSIVLNHNHPIINGIIQAGPLNHFHSLIFP